MGRPQMERWIVVAVGLLVLAVVAANPRRILYDTDFDTDDLFALLYLLKQNRSEFDLKAITISANGWADAGHAVNQAYDILHMMDRDDIPVGVGGDGGISHEGNIFSNVGGYLPLIEQGMSTAGYCRYRQAIPIGGGRLIVDTNYGIRRGFLPQGYRKYTPLSQPTAQQVMIDTISAGPTTVLVTGSQTNLALFLMKYPQLKKNIQHIYVMGGGVRSKNPTGCCPKNAGASCTPEQCGDVGNLFSAYRSNPYAEFNIFMDPFAAYQVLHSGIPVTLVPLDATNTIPVDSHFFAAFEQNQNTFEAQYSFQSLIMTRDTWFDDKYYTSFFMWDSFLAGVAVSDMRNGHRESAENEFADMEYLNITVVTSNTPYGINSDGSNPFFDGHFIPKFRLKRGGVHSGHVQMGPADPFCSFQTKGKGRCQDGYTKEVNGSEAVRVLVATKAKPNREAKSPLNRQFYTSFLEVLNLPQQSGRFNFYSQFPCYKEDFYKPDFGNRKMGKPLVFDMDMSAGDFLALIFLLKVPVEVIDLKAILVSGNGWADPATIDVVYDVLHMMGRDDIPVGLGSLNALGTPNLGCRYVEAIPHGSGGFIDSDTLYGLARNLPRSPRRFTADNSIKYGAPRNTSHPELRQPSALEVWNSISRKIDPSQKMTVLTNGPLTNIASILLSDKNASSTIQNLYVVGGHIAHREKGNLFTVQSNKYAEFNMYLDPLAAKTVLESDLDITLIPLQAQRQVTSFPRILRSLQFDGKTAELKFSQTLLSLLHKLQQQHKTYQHMDIFLGEILGAVFMANQGHLDPIIQKIKISAMVGNKNTDGQLFIDETNGRVINILDSLNSEAYYYQYAKLLSEMSQSAVVGSFDQQKKKWCAAPEKTT